jgi:hypothetical protein
MTSAGPQPTRRRTCDEEADELGRHIVVARVDDLKHVRKRQGEGRKVCMAELEPARLRQSWSQRG